MDEGLRDYLLLITRPRSNCIFYSFVICSYIFPPSPVLPSVPLRLSAARGLGAFPLPLTSFRSLLLCC